MTPEKRESLRDIIRHCTPAPWYAEVRGNSILSYAIPHVCNGLSMTSGNVAFICIARNELPELLSDLDAKDAEIAALKQQLAGVTRERDAAVSDIKDLANGAYSICDMCKKLGKTPDTTDCPYGCYSDQGTSRAIDTYPDEPCDEFTYYAPDGAESEEEHA